MKLIHKLISKKIKDHLRIDFILVIIIIIGSLLRLQNLAIVPSGLHIDEAQSAYNGYLIGKHLKNIHGEFFPTDIDYFEDYRPALSSYLTAPFTFLLGNNEIAARLPSALAGIFTIFLAYELCLLLLKDRNIARFSALFLAVSPYHVVFSRASTDGIIDVMWSILSLICITSFFKGKGIKWVFLAYIFWVLGFFTYQTSRFLTPIIVLATTVYGSVILKVNSKKVLIVILFLIAFFIFPLGYFIKSGKAGGRFDQVSVFSFPETQRSLNETITESGYYKLNPNIVRTFHNKITAYAQDIGRRYISFFSPDTVLFNTTLPIRYSVKNLGMITIFEFIGLLSAVYFSIRKKEKKMLLFFGMLLIAPIPSAITFEASPNFQRAIYLLPFWQILAGYGTYLALTSLAGKSKAILYLVGSSIFIWYVAFFLYQYFLITPVHEPFYRAYEQKEVAKYLASDANKYKKIVLSDNAGTYLYYLYFNKLDVFNLYVDKPTKYFREDFKLSNLNFKKERCIDDEKLFAREYELVVQFEDCPVYPFLEKEKEFRRKDKSLAVLAYKINNNLLRDYLDKKYTECIIQINNNSKESKEKCRKYINTI
ncbi:MAG: Glycosyl transferase family 39 [Candidatus Curtissbacteria bacterium GW2011_GWA1_40_16]|uniref:Glycosyl transferase family 39 n=1 Tax=Candidatus Curtissbacteria bacterium GW2011_GWA1_40_16 TaxID=1618405 RepID=A0A0G0TQY1_9BACT|nr:MAG: Glycosyl transferase family 39 [Candidatus Curtissbacteria bacterium GW2011_GWA1_40_16]